MTKKRLTKQQLVRIANNKQVDLASQNTKENEGLVTAVLGKTVEIENNQQKIICNLRQNIPQIAVGDKVFFIYDDLGNPIVTNLTERQSVLTRTINAGNKKIIAANIKLAILVLAVKPTANLQLVDRYLVNTSLLQIPTIIIFNKIDLLDTKEKQTISEKLKIYQEIDYGLHFVSVKEPNSLIELNNILKNKISIFIGQSGVGKSSLIKQFLPGSEIKIADISLANEKGCHTTTTARLYHLVNGGSIIDSPGIRDLPLHDVTKKDLATGFAEFKDLLNSCKFSNCSHIQEPNCAIKQAVKIGKIAKSRYESYCYIFDSLKH